MCHNDTWDSFVLWIKDFIVINFIPLIFSTFFLNYFL